MYDKIHYKLKKKVKVLVSQSGPILFNPMDYIPLPIEFSRPEYWNG